MQHMTPSLVRISALLSVVLAASCARHNSGASGLGIGAAPAFETRVEVETGSATHADYYVADFDGDGVLDWPSSA